MKLLPLAKSRRHYRLHRVFIGHCILRTVCQCCARHIFATFGSVLVLWAFLLYLLQILDNALHFLLPCLLAWFYATYYLVNPILSLLKLLLICFLHVLLNSLWSNHSQVILYNINILINLWNFLSFVQ